MDKFKKRLVVIFFSGVVLFLGGCVTKREYNSQYKVYEPLEEKLRQEAKKEEIQKDISRDSSAEESWVESFSEENNLVKECPVCKRRYPESVKECPYDGAELKNRR